jgi:hemerythrin
MVLMEWSDTFSVGVAEMDAQHKQLIAILNELYDAMRAARSKEVMSGILSRLHQYTKTHFSNEERYLAQAGYAKLAEQQAQHKAFVAKLEKAEKDYAAGLPTVGGEMMNFLRDWLKHHILEIDMDYNPAK